MKLGTQHLLRLAGAVLLTLTLGLVGQISRADTVTVFAAASTKTALDHAAADWSNATGVQVRISYGGSSTLARQILAGAPADLFVSANVAWMDAVEKDDMLLAGSRRALFGNELVLIAYGDGQDPFDLDELPTRLGEARLAMGLVTAVPAGIYGKASLVSLGLWSALSDRIAQTDNVRAALALVAAGEAPFGIVYATDALVSDDVLVVARFDPSSHPKITYPLAVLRGRNSARASDFANFLFAPAQQAIFKELGFVPVTAH